MSAPQQSRQPRGSEEALEPGDGASVTRLQTFCGNVVLSHWPKSKCISFRGFGYSEIRSWLRSNKIARIDSASTTIG